MPSTPQPNGELSYKQAQRVAAILLEFGYADVIIHERKPSSSRWVTGSIRAKNLRFTTTVDEVDTVDLLVELLEHYRTENDLHGFRRDGDEGDEGDEGLEG